MALINRKRIIRRIGKHRALGVNHARRSLRVKELESKVGKVNRARSSPRLYMKGTLAGYKRGLHGQHKRVALIRVENVVSKEDASWYVGKRICYVYHGYKEKRCVRWAKAPVRRSNTRAIWGHLVKPHGCSGILQARFKKTVPADALGKRIRVYLYPSRI